MTVSGEPYIIVVTYTNGTASNFSNCTAIAETDAKLMFKGKKDGDTEEKLWTIVLANVTEYSKKSQ